MLVYVAIYQGTDQEGDKVEDFLMIFDSEEKRKYFLDRQADQYNWFLREKEVL
jgi:hypothetical protein